MKNGNQINLMVYPTSDPQKSKKLFNAFLGVDPYIDGDYYIGYRMGDQEIGWILTRLKARSATSTQQISRAP